MWFVLFNFTYLVRSARVVVPVDYRMDELKVSRNLLDSKADKATSPMSEFELG